MPNIDYLSAVEARLDAMLATRARSLSPIASARRRSARASPGPVSLSSAASSSAFIWSIAACVSADESDGATYLCLMPAA